MVPLHSNQPWMNDWIKACSCVNSGLGKMLVQSNTYFSPTWWNSKRPAKQKGDTCVKPTIWSFNMNLEAFKQMFLQKPLSDSAASGKGIASAHESRGVNKVEPHFLKHNSHMGHGKCQGWTRKPPSTPVGPVSWGSQLGNCWERNCTDAGNSWSTQLLATVHSDREFVPTNTVRFKVKQPQRPIATLTNMFFLSSLFPSSFVFVFIFVHMRHESNNSYMLHLHRQYVSMCWGCPASAIQNKWMHTKKQCHYSL